MIGGAILATLTVAGCQHLPNEDASSSARDRMREVCKYEPSIDAVRDILAIVYPPASTAISIAQKVAGVTKIVCDQVNKEKKNTAKGAILPANIAVTLRTGDGAVKSIPLRGYFVR